MSSKSTGRMFQLKVDPLTGKSEWVVIEEEVDDISPKPMLASTCYLDMLNDAPRNRAYRDAIDRSVSKDCHVLDIGSGTGLLSMMAARAMGGKAGRVTACESYLPMVKLMKKVLRANDMLDANIRLINKRSDELQLGVDIASRAHVLVSEILDSQLLGEGLIPSLQHACDNLLVENYQTVPYRATTYGQVRNTNIIIIIYIIHGSRQLVESRWLWKLHDLFNHEASVADGVGLVPKGKESLLQVKPQQLPMHCDALAQDIRLLSEPFKIFEFEFWKRPRSHGQKEVLIKATDDGTVHAVISWWVLELDEEGKILYSTAPSWIGSSREWCDHWKQCVWFSKGKGLPVCKDTDVCMEATHNETSISYRFKSYVDDSLPIITLSPERIAIYGDREWRHSMLKAISYALEGKESPLCVVGDDSVFVATAVAHVSKTAHVVCLFPGIGEEKGLEYLEAVADENGYSMDRVQVSKQQWTHQNKVDLLIAEPFYFGAEGMLPWHNLQFWSKRTMLDSVLSEDVCIMPCKGILKACAMSLPDLWRSRRSLEKIQGFDHSMSVVNSILGASSSEAPCLPFFIWQCGEAKRLSETYSIMEFDLSKPLASCDGRAEVAFVEAGVCHGFALWIDWVMDATNNILISTGPTIINEHLSSDDDRGRYWKQGVKLFADPLLVPPGVSCSALIHAYFDSSTGHLSLHHI